MTDFHITPKEYSSPESEVVNTYRESKQTFSERNKAYREKIELRLRKMGTKKIKAPVKTTNLI